MKTCPQCGNSLPKEAHFCPKCMYEYERVETHVPKIEGQYSEERKWKKGILTVVMLVMAICVSYLLPVYVLGVAFTAIGIFFTIYELRKYRTK